MSRWGASTSPTVALRGDGVRKRRSFLTLTAVFIGLACVAHGQQPAPKRIGILSPGTPPITPFGVRVNNEFLEALRGHGWIEGQNVTIERRYAAGRLDALPDLAAELVALKVDVIYAHSGTAGLAAKKATQSIPIVALSGDMVGHGLVADLARPEANVTGQSFLSVEVASKRLHLLRELLPSASRVAVLTCAGWRPGSLSARAWDSVEHTAKGLRLQLLRYSPETAQDIQAALQDAARNHAEGLLLFDCPAFNAVDRTILLRHRFPAIYYLEAYARAGGLMAYGPDELAIFRRSAWYLDRILRGAKASDLPVEQAMTLRLIINLKTAKELKLTIPTSVLVRADEVIE
jgi:putative ABC transport system substrate-binding protein